MPLRDKGYGLVPVVDVAPLLLERFDCGKEHLNRFLVEARTLHADRLGFTAVAFHQDYPGQVIGYFTLANDGLPLTTSEQGELGLCDDVTLSSFPAVKVCRLAVARGLQRQGVGRQLMALVHGEIHDAASLSAARIVIVDADNTPEVVSFYAALGYRNSLWAERQARHHGPAMRRGPPQAVKMIRDILAG